MIDFASDPRGVQLRLLLERAKYERYLLSEVDRILLDTFIDVATKLLSPAFRDLSAFQEERTRQLLAEVNARLTAGYQTLSDTAVRELSGYSGIEGAVAHAQLAGIIESGTEPIGVTLGAFLPPSFTTAIARLGGVNYGVTSLSVQGLTMRDWYDAQLGTMSVATRRTIQQGLVQGLPTREISRLIVPSTTSTEPAVLKRAQRDATAITRTAVTAVHNDAAQTSYKDAGGDITNSYRYVAVRDNRTTPQCRAADGRVFRYDDPARLIPPLHFSCRSTTIPLLAGGLAAKLGLGLGAGPVHSFATYDDWLKAQSQTEQNGILGPTRADLWRSGRMTLADAVDQDGRTLTLKQLREKVAPAIAAPAGAL